MDFDLIIIGSGPAGHTAALEASRFGFKTAVIEKDPVMIGGVCLNEGCIPLKGFLHYSNSIKDFAVIKETVLKSVGLIRQGLKARLEGKGISIINGFAKFTSANTIEVGSNGGKRSMSAKYFLIAAGSTPKRFFKNANVFNPEKIFSLDKAPATALIIGGGVIGCEYASFLNNIGVSVTIAELTPSLLPGEDGEAVRTLEREFKKEKIKIFTGAKVKEIRDNGEAVIETAAGTTQDAFEIIFEATGRMPSVAGLNIEAAGLKTDHRGFIPVSDYMETGVDNVYAAGDCIDTPMLAYTASKEAEVAVMHMAGRHVKRPDYVSMPRMVFSFPQVGSAGLSEAEAREKGYDIKIYKYFFKAIGKAAVENNDAGFLKLITDTQKDEILGAVAVGGEITDMMNELAVIIKHKIRIEELKETLHIHPSYSEIIIEALNWGE